MLTRHHDAGRDPGRRHDKGFSLIEVVVAMVVFAVIVTAVLGVMIKVFDVTRSNTHRVAAANLATKQIESTRSMRTIDIPDGATTRLETVAGTEFTITQTANYVVAGSESRICQGSGDQLSYKLVTVTVEWPGMGSVKPVRSDTLKALGLGENGLASTNGVLAIAVTGATGTPMAGVKVTLSPGGATRTTGVDGCAVFAGLVPRAAYTATAGQEGFVAHTNTRAARLTQGVAAGRITRATLLYDRERALAVDVAAPPGYLPPTDWPLSYRSNYVDDGAVLPSCGSAVAGSACLTSLPGSVLHLFPAVYQLSVGTCVESGTVDVDLVNGDGAVTLPLGGFRLVVQNPTGQPLPNRDVVATRCSGSEAYSIASDEGGQRLVALPYDKWTFTAAGACDLTSTISAGDRVRDVVLVVGCGGSG